MEEFNSKLENICSKRLNFIKKLKWAIEPEKIGLINSLKNTSNKKKLVKSNLIEKKYCNEIVKSQQWSAIMSETLVKELLELNGIKVKNPIPKNGYRPDFETIDNIYEIKSRSWTISGTIGEKVMGVPLKYSEVPKLYNKPLIIICVAYQEYELTYGNFAIFDNVSENRKKVLDFYEKELNIKFIRFSDFANKYLKNF